jgi:RNA polymerase sigma-70 factor, ECF subfamily
MSGPGQRCTSETLTQTLVAAYAKAVGQTHWLPSRITVPVSSSRHSGFLPRLYDAASLAAKYCIVERMGAIQNKLEQPVSEELALVRAAKQGDDSAFEELVRRYDRNVFRIAQHITQNREDAEDVVQEAFLKAYGNLAKFQEQSKFYTWLVRIAVNEALMKLRRRKPERTVSLDEDIKTEDDSLPREIADWSPNPEQQYTQAELREILSKTIQGLPPGFRTVFVLRDVEGLSTEETAAALELSVPAVKSRLLRARLQLRERLGRYFQRRDDNEGKGGSSKIGDVQNDVASGDGNQ